MLPVPFVDYIPRWFRRDEKLLALSDKMDSIIENLKSDTIGLNDLFNPLSAPEIVLEKLGFFLNAGIKPYDDVNAKRIKIATAIQSHKKRGSFVFDAKPKIDAIAGGNSQILKNVGEDDWIIVGDGSTPLAYYWSAFGADGIDDNLGVTLVGAGDELKVAGNIYINVDNSTLSAEDQNKVKLEMEDIVPAYYYVHFGYVDLSGSFVEYFVMGN